MTRKQQLNSGTWGGGGDGELIHLWGGMRWRANPHMGGGEWDGELIHLIGGGGGDEMES